VTVAVVSNILSLSSQVSERKRDLVNHGFRVQPHGVGPQIKLLALACLVILPGTGRSAPESIRPTSAPNAVDPPQLLGQSAPSFGSFRPNTYPKA